MEIAEYCERMTGKPITEWQRKIMEEVVRNPNCQIVMPKCQKSQKFLLPQVRYMRMQRLITISQYKNNNFRKQHHLPLLRGEIKKRYRELIYTGWEWSPMPNGWVNPLDELRHYTPVGNVPDAVLFAWQNNWWLSGGYCGGGMFCSMPPIGPANWNRAKPYGL